MSVADSSLFAANLEHTCRMDAVRSVDSGGLQELQHLRALGRWSNQRSYLLLPKPTLPCFWKAFQTFCVKFYYILEHYCIIFWSFDRYENHDTTSHSSQSALSERLQRILRFMLQTIYKQGKLLQCQQVLTVIYSELPRISLWAE